MKLFFTDMMIISGININDYKKIDSDYYEYPWVENGEANVQIYKRLIRLDERNFLRGLEQGWGGVGLRTDIEKKIHIMFACGVQEVWKKTDFIIKFINISFKAYTSTWINKKPIDTGFEYIRYLRSRFFFPRRSCLWIHGRQDDQKTRDAFIWLIYITLQVWSWTGCGTKISSVIFNYYVVT